MKMTHPELEGKEIYMVMLYQAVKFNKTQLTYFHSNANNGRTAKRIKLIENLGAVLIEDDYDSILVPLTNVSAVHLKSKVREENDEEWSSNEKVDYSSKKGPKKVKKISSDKNILGL